MQREGDWCYVRANSKDGYMMTDYVKLMGVEEEAAYIAIDRRPGDAPRSDGRSDADPDRYPRTHADADSYAGSHRYADPDGDAGGNGHAIPTETPEITAEPTAVPTATPAPVQLSLYARVTATARPLRGTQAIRRTCKTS